MAISYFCGDCGFETKSFHALEKHRLQHKIEELKKSRDDAQRASEQYALAALLFFLFFLVRLLIILIQEARR